MTTRYKGVLPRLIFAAAWFSSLLASGVGVAAAADPLEELRAVSGLIGLDAKRLLHGEIFSERGTQGSFVRGAYAESCYFVKAPVAITGSTLLHWDPSKYKEAEVDVYQSYHWPASPEEFKKFRLSTKRATDRQLIDATAAAGHGEKGTLHLRPGDAEILRQTLTETNAQDESVTAAWRQILQQRNDAMVSSGFAGLPEYQAGGVNIRAADEFKSLLKMTPGIAARFAALTEAKPFFTESADAADEVAPYAEQSQVNGHTSLCLGMLAARKTPGAWQVLDCTYYTADTYFLSVSLYQLWPWEDGTLVWQVDYVSAPFRSYLGGLDRLFAGKEISKDSAESIRLFRREISGGSH